MASNASELDPSASEVVLHAAEQMQAQPSIEVVDPATGQSVTSVPATTAEETDVAISRARTAFDTWRKVSPADRARLLRRFAAEVDAHIEELARLEVRNAGHTIGNARWEAGNVRDVLDYYAGHRSG